MNEIFRSFEAEIDSVLEGERAVVARVNTAGVDRLKTVIDPLGCDVTSFNKTRSVLWHHGQDPIRGMVPIGQGWVKVRRSERDMLGKTTFGTDDFSELLFQKYKTGELRGWSIKAGVHEATPPTKEEIRSQPALEDCEMIYRKWDLIEFSATPTPGNSDCLTMLVSRGLITAPEGFTPAEPVEQVERYITHSGKKWIVHAESGKVLGEHDNEGDAKKQLAAIEAHKHDKERSVPCVESDGSFWYVRGLSLESPRFTSESDANDVLRMLEGAPPSIERFHFDLITQARTSNDQFKRDLEDMMNLKLWGRV